MKVFLKLLRVKQWVKNLFLICPLIFSGHFLNGHLWFYALGGIAAFCLISSGVYIINDILDCKTDKLHPRKSLRPIASGQINESYALCLSSLLLISGLIVASYFSANFLKLAVLYLFLNVIYNLFTKRIVILDVLTLALGFLLRVLAGACVTHIVPSLWLLICVFSLALFLGFTKRRCEIAVLESCANTHRSVLSSYSINFLNQIIMISSTLVIVFYGLYAISPDVVARVGGYEMFYSLPFVIYGIFRYLFLTHEGKLGGEPEEIFLSDVPLLIDMFLWLLVMIIIILHAR